MKVIPEKSCVLTLISTFLLDFLDFPIKTEVVLPQA